MTDNYTQKNIQSYSENKFLHNSKMTAHAFSLYSIRKHAGFTLMLHLNVANKNCCQKQEISFRGQTKDEVRKNIIKTFARVTHYQTTQ